LRKATIYVSERLKNNNIFNLEDPKYNRDNCLYPFWLLKRELKKYNYDLSTQDINDPGKSEFVLYSNIPKINRFIIDKIFKKTKNNYLITREPPIIRKENWLEKYHKYFKKIFTWNDNLVDGNKYIKLNYSFKIPDKIPTIDFNKKDFCCMIAGNKSSQKTNEHYSERLKLIKFFENNHLDKFNLYGIGWDKKRFNFPFSVLSRIDFISKILAEERSSYKGAIEIKKDVLKNYKFSVCYENSVYPGYITEKIFDAFFAGSIPIYLGANNITDYIPEDTFIDKRHYSSYKELYKKINSVDENKYNQIIDNIISFLNSDKITKFSADNFVEIIIYEILGINNKKGNYNGRY